MGVSTDISLITLAEYKRYEQGSTTGSTENDAQWEKTIDATCRYFNTFTGRHLKAKDYADYLDGNGTSEIYYPQYPINSTAITCYLGTLPFPGTSYAEDSTDILVYSTEGKLILYDNYFPEGRQNIYLALNAGYSTSSGIPPDLSQAAKEMTRFWWNRESKRDLIGVRSESAEGFSRSFETDMPWSVKKVLDLYRKID